MGGNVVNVYAKTDDVKPLATATVAATATSATLSIAQLGADGGKVYISVLALGKTVSDKLEVSFDKEPQTGAPEASNIVIANNKVGKPDTIKVSGLGAGDVVKVYKSGTTTLLGTATVVSGKTDVTLSITQLGTTSGAVDVTITSKDKRESAKTNQTYTAEA
uniref:Uncharacterized protein n=1 Tax=Paenibacillus athensensis TaxID=1967502 RepID=A0A4Y8Q986_9BACL